MNKLYFSTKSEKQAAALAARLAALDGKRPFVVWTGNGNRFEFSKSGALESATAGKAHFDALDIWPDMDEKTFAAVKQRAAARMTVREKEEAAGRLLSLDSMTDMEENALLALVNVAYHGSGKIEGCHSVDGCAACGFCQKMRAAAEGNPLMICRLCYAAADAWKEVAWRIHQVNARILSSHLFPMEKLARLAIGALCRFNEDGDTVNTTHARNLLRIGISHPGTNCGYWYKNGPAVESGLHAEGFYTRDSLPENIRFIHSSALIGFPAVAAWFDDAVFTVYPDKATTEAAIAAGAHACNGRKCLECGYTCYRMRRTENVLYIAEYLRCNKAERAAVLAAYEKQRARLDGRTA